MTTTAMTPSGLTTDCLDAIGFSRLHALVARGYRPALGAATGDSGHSYISLTHPRADRTFAPPPVTLWSDGILTTNKVLFPDKYVPEEDKGPPDWQRFILPAEADAFATFASSIAMPGIADLYLEPAWAQAKVFLVKLVIGGMLCVLLGVSCKVILAQV